MLIKNKNNKVSNKIAKTKKPTILIFYILSSILILGLSINFLLQTSLAQINENKTNISIANNEKSDTSLTTDSKKPMMYMPNQIIVIAEDIEEIRDNLQEARESLNDANYLEVLSHINNIDQLLTTIVVKKPSIAFNNMTQNTDAAAADSTGLASLNNNVFISNDNNKIITLTDNDAAAELKINEQLFVPNNLTVSKGSNVTWINKDNIPHTITLKKLGEQPKEFQFALSLGDLYTHPFDEAGVYGFYSQQNKWSEGKIIVS
jgi:plastocyanin